MQFTRQPRPFLGGCCAASSQTQVRRVDGVRTVVTKLPEYSERRLMGPAGRRIANDDPALPVAGHIDGSRQNGFVFAEVIGERERNVFFVRTNFSTCKSDQR